MAGKKLIFDTKEPSMTLRQELKNEIKKKAKEKEGIETEKKDLISGLLKLYKETVDFALRENVIVQTEQNSSSRVEPEIFKLSKDKLCKNISVFYALCQHAARTASVKDVRQYPANDYKLTPDFSGIYYMKFTLATKATFENIPVTIAYDSHIQFMNCLEVEIVDKQRVNDVNEMCAKSEELLTCTIKKRKLYPRKIKESLRLKHKTQLNDLKELEDKINNEKSDIDETCSGILDMSECEASCSRLKPACDGHIQFSKSLSDKKEKFERFNTAAKLKLKMQEDDLHRMLFSKRKLPSSFDSILVTPTKEKLDESSPEPGHKTLAKTWSYSKNELQKGCVQDNPPDQPQED